MMASIDATIAPTIATASSAKIVWDLFLTTYAIQETHSHFTLCDQLQNLNKAFKRVATYLQELSMLLDLWWLMKSFPIRSSDTALSFEELFQKFTGHELFLKHQDIDKPSTIIIIVVA